MSETRTPRLEWHEQIHRSLEGAIQDKFYIATAGPFTLLVEIDLGGESDEDGCWFWSVDITEHGEGYRKTEIEAQLAAEDWLRGACREAGEKLGEEQP